MLDDLLNLKILQNICAGAGVSVNISELSKRLGKHRNTIKNQVDALFEHKIITTPFYSFARLFTERPLLAIVKANLEPTPLVEKHLIEDRSIFAAFRSWDDRFNTLLFEFHKDMYSYYQWKERKVTYKKLPHHKHRTPYDVLFFDNNLIIKYDPNSTIHCMEEMFEQEGTLIINDYEINALGLAILKLLLDGKGIKTNENLLAAELDVNRRTVERRIHDLIKHEIVHPPRCKFPKFFVPPGFVLVFGLIRINKRKEDIFRKIRQDPHIPIAYEGLTGRYNMLYFGAYPDVESHFQWEERYLERFTDCFGAMKKIYLSPKMTASIDQRRVSLGVIQEKIDHLSK